jgi:hypothetical protein
MAEFTKVVPNRAERFAFGFQVTQNCSTKRQETSVLLQSLPGDLCGFTFPVLPNNLADRSRRSGNNFGLNKQENDYSYE